MSGNWHNFFFNAFDPAGFVSLDKPPVAFWI
jgi:4-amino-4-deoxy-L-arabinose transferase-like glycosyltransferase